MRSAILWAIVGWIAASGGIASSSARAGEPYFARSGWGGSGACGCLAPFDLCCDDYCRRPLPGIPCRPDRRECDDYCRRPTPCTVSPMRGCCDDYDCKPAPRTCWSRSPKLTCVPYCTSISDESPATTAKASSPPSSPSSVRATPAASSPKIRWVR